MKRAVRVLLMSAVLVLAPRIASAESLLDKLNAATKKLNEASQRAQQGSQPQTQGEQVQSGGGGSLSAGLGATSFEALSQHESCFDSLKGLRAKITADKLAQKMAAVNPSGQERTEWEADIMAWRMAQQVGTDQATSPDPKSPHRGIDRLTRAEQTDINAAFGAKYNAVTSECQGRDHMNAGHKTKMNYIQDNSATEASTAKHAAAMEGYTECVKSVQGLRMRITADVLEHKLQNQQDLSAKDRQDWEADIASFRTAAAQHLMMPPAVDPKQPTRALQRLAMDDQMAISQQYGTASQEQIANCSAQAGSGQIEEGAPRRSGGLVDHATAPSNPFAKKPERKAAVGTGIGGTTNLEYMRRTAGCEKPIQGHLAKLTADKLQAKLHAASGLSPQKRQEWEADIAAWRAAQQAGADQATPLDPGNPYRWYDYLTKQERQEINTQHAAFSSKVMQECAKQSAGL